MVILEKKKIKLVVVDSKCQLYKKDDEIVFDGPTIDKKRSATLCMTALQSLYLYIFAGRHGYLWDSLIQCPDCDESVSFKVAEDE